ALPLMGMRSFDKKSDLAVRKSDVSIAKNYLTEDEIKLLGLLVEQYLVFAETMALQRNPMYMNDWIARLDAIIQLNGRDLFTHAGKISHQMALEKSALELDKYHEVQRQIQHDGSMKELEQDIMQLQKPASRQIKDGARKQR
ncbi:MAG: RhuM family protein, partial [Pedobacter sp.]